MSETKEQQHFFMRYAIQLGEKGRLTTPPNPWVGCVLVKQGEIVGEGYHVSVGEAHAEVKALEKAGGLAKGATAYISLEPCSHQGRTPPCINALIQAGVKKVVIPFLDPNPLVRGQGVQALKQAGVEVILGVAKEEAEKSLEPYLYHCRTGLTFCVLKSAMSIDGRIAASDGTSKWITSEEARRDAHFLRAQSGAILIGSKTALIDRPQLTVRHIDVKKQPLRVVVDSKGVVLPEGPLFDPSIAPTLVFTSHRKWEKRGIEVIELPKVTLAAVLKELGKKEIMQLLVEGGAELHSAFIQEGLAHRFYLYIGNCLLGPKGKPLFPSLDISTMIQAPRWELEGVHRFGSSTRLDYRTLLKVV